MHVHIMPAGAAHGRGAFLKGGGPGSARSSFELIRNSYAPLWTLAYVRFERNICCCVNNAHYSWLFVRGTAALQQALRTMPSRRRSLPKHRSSRSSSSSSRHRVTRARLDDDACCVLLAMALVRSCFMCVMCLSTSHARFTQYGQLCLITTYQKHKTNKNER